MRIPCLPLLLFGLIAALVTLNLARAQRAPLPESVKVERDIVYAGYGDREVMLDLYLPKHPPSDKIPCIVVIHGGGWRNGDKTKFARQAAYLADQGFAAACIGYRLLPEVKFPDPILDCKAAVRWVRAHAAEHGIDPDRIGATGGSAGGHLTAMLATSHKVKELEGEGGSAGASSRIQAAVAMAPPCDMSRYAERTGADPALARLISPIAHVDADSAPMLMIHSTNDRVVPLAQSEAMLTKCRELDLIAEVVRIENGGHAFWNQNRWFDEVMNKTVAFFREHLN
jgi:pectinesterase